MFARLQIRVHHAALNRARTHDGHLDYQVVKAAGFEARQHAHLRPALDLEHAHGVGAANHVVSRSVFRRNILHPENRAALRTDEVQATANGTQHA